jgi:uncharacterized membrane protein
LDSEDPTPPRPEPTRRHHSFPGRILASLRNNLIAGVVVIAPIGLTVWLIWTLLGWVDGFVWPFVPNYYHPDEIINRVLGLTGEDAIEVNVRGVGVIVFLTFTVLIGWIAKGLVGRSLLRWGEDLVGRLPVVRSIYNGLKQIAETVFTQQEATFDKACLIEYPRRGVWAMGFISARAKGEIARKVQSDNDLIGVFMPTTPNPTTGFLMFLPRSEIIELDMSLEQAAKLIISAGLVYPEDLSPKSAVPSANLLPRKPE